MYIGLNDGEIHLNFKVLNSYDERQKALQHPLFDFEVQQ